MEIIVFAVFMVLWKGLDTVHSMYQMHLQAKIELNRTPEAATDNEEKHIGFTDYGVHLREIEEEEEE